MKCRWFLNLLLGLIFCTSSFLLLGCDAVINSGDVLIRAETLINKGNNESAIEILRPYIYKNDNSFKAHLLIGQAILNLNINDHKNLYLARYYFNKASKLAPNENQRLSADQAYADLRLLMGNAGKSGDTILESANRASTLGNSDQAIKLYLKAANLFVQDESYGDAIESCRHGLRNNPDKENKFALSLAMSRAMFLNKDYKDCADIDLSIEDPDINLPPIYTYEAEFLEVAPQFMLIERQRNWRSLMKKVFSNEDKQVALNLFDKSLECLKKFEANSGEDLNFRIGQYSLLLARHSKNCDLKLQAKKAYEYSRSVFYRTGFEKDALKVGEEMEEIDG